jgi:hypothetical protein
MRYTTLLPCLALPIAVYAMAVGCSSSSSSDGDGQTDGSGGNGGTDAHVNTDAPAVSGNGGGGKGGSGASSGSAGSGASGEDADTCAAPTQKADLIPLDMLIMMDSSASMDDKAAGSDKSKWTLITAALSDFMNSQKSTDIGVGIHYFPLRDNANPTACPGGVGCGSTGVCTAEPTGDLWCHAKCNENTNDPVCGKSECVKDQSVQVPAFCSNASCDMEAYATPEVEIAPLPGAAADVIDSMKNHRPEGGTPTVPALQGAIKYASAWASNQTARKTVVVFATDGLPTLCPYANESGAVEQAKQAAANAISGDPSIKTFVIGIMSSDTSGGNGKANLDAIAIAGGRSEGAFMVEPNADVGTQFAKALENIRGSISCEIKVPPPPDGGPALDYGKVNVIYVPGTGDSVTFGYADDESKCDATEGGWYYDVNPNDAAPTRILLCPASCSKVQNDSAGKVEIQIGCFHPIVGPK